MSTYAQEMKSKYGVPFNPKEVKSARGFRLGDHVVMVCQMDFLTPGCPARKGDTGKVGAIRGFKGMSVSPDPLKHMIWVEWTKHGGASVDYRCIKKVGGTGSVGRKRARRAVG